ncbi:MAG TPA: TetR/AcrR family transcriptional regulator [Pseudomonadales bacterium]
MQVAGAKPPGNRRDQRRIRALLKAFHDCVIEKGYAHTTLAEVARAAGMSPSHLMYYFRGKDAILDEYFRDIAERIVARIERARGEPPRRQLEKLAELFFAGRTLTRSEIGLMHECFGIAVHDERLRATKSEFDRYCKAYLVELFEQLPLRGFTSAKDAAEVVFAQLFGLRTAVYFDDDLDLPRALAIYKASIRQLTGDEAETGNVSQKEG